MAVWLVIALVLFTVFKQFDTRGQAGNGYLAYSDFLEEVRGKRIKSATIQEGQGGTEIIATTTDDRKVRTNATYLDRGLVGDLIANNVKFDVKPREEGSLLMTLLVSWGPMLLLIGVWVYFMRQMQGGGKGGAFSFGKSKARMLDENNNTVTFADVAGCDEAKEEVKEVVDFLKDPQKFQKLGGRIPRGLLLVGPPGTGKTLLAKGIAGEAKVPFFSISGSDFVEMFVGVGAARVRDMFENAKKNAPCIIFIDEIDAVGRQRGAGLGGGNDEREQTLNQMLVEMDGFETNLGVIVVAATNRPDILDAALLRPGRFDRQVYVTLPDIRGREQILNVHMRKIPVGQDVSPSVIARGTPGMSGADLAHFVLLLAVCLLAFLNLERLGKREYRSVKENPRFWGVATGLVAGLFEATANVSGPPLLMYFIMLGLAPSALVQLLNFSFIGGKATQIITWSVSGGIGFGFWLSTVPWALMAVVTLYMGQRVRSRLDATAYMAWLRKFLWAMVVLLLLQYGWGQWQEP